MTKRSTRRGNRQGESSSICFFPRQKSPSDVLALRLWKTCAKLWQTRMIDESFSISLLNHCSSQHRSHRCDHCRCRRIRPMPLRSTALFSGQHPRDSSCCGSPPVRPTDTVRLNADSCRPSAVTQTDAAPATRQAASPGFAIPHRSVLLPRRLHRSERKFPTSWIPGQTPIGLLLGHQGAVNHLIL